MKKPLLSVITLNYNYARYLPDTLHSVANQNYENMEYILIDDASTDNSADIMQQFANKHSYCKLYREKENKGFYSGYRKSLKLAAGKYIFWLSSDDYTAPGFFQEVVSFMESFPEMMICTSFCQRFTDDGQQLKTLVFPQLKKRFYTPEEVCGIQKKLNFSIPSTATIWRKEALLKHNSPYEDLGPLDDQYVNYKLAFTYGLGIIPKIFGFFRVHEKAYSQRVSHRNPKALKERKKIYHNVVQRLLSEEKTVRRLFLRSDYLLFHDRLLVKPLLMQPSLWRAIPRFTLKKMPRYIRNCLRRSSEKSPFE